MPPDRSFLGAHVCQASCIGLLIVPMSMQDKVDDYM